MIIQLSLQEAVSKVYGKSLTNIGSPVTQWKLFSPFSTRSQNTEALLMLLQVPANLYTSQQIHKQRLDKYRGILHQVQFVFVQRYFQSCYYLVIAEQNLLPIDSILKINSQSKEKISQKIIFDFIQFSNKLLDHQFSHQFTFNQTQIGINSKGKFQLANYLLYFQNQQNISRKTRSTQKQPNNNLKNDIKTILTKMLVPQKQNINFSEFYQTVSQRYGKNMTQIVGKIMQSESDLNQITTLISNIKSSRSTDQQFCTATITDSCLDDVEKMSQILMNQSCNLSSNDLTLNKIKKQKNSLKKKNKFIFIVITVLILLCALAITFRYLFDHSQILCEQEEGKYLDQLTNTCKQCDPSCLTCKGGESNMCKSCKGNQFLIIKDQKDSVGKCGEVCHGRTIKPKTCVVDH